MSPVSISGVLIYLAGGREELLAAFCSGLRVWNRISFASCRRSDKSLNLRLTQPQALAPAGNETEQWFGTCTIKEVGEEKTGLKAYGAFREKCRSTKQF